MPFIRDVSASNPVLLSLENDADGLDDLLSRGQGQKSQIPLKRAYNEKRRDSASAVCRVLALGVATVVLLSALRSTAAAESDTRRDRPAGHSWFLDQAQRTGLNFEHFNGMTGQFYFPEMTGQGGALLDFDGDGDLDLYLIQGSLLGSDETLQDALFAPPVGVRLADRLLRNDSVSRADGSQGVNFVDVTDRAGIVAPGYGMGVAVGDIDGNGWPDIYVTNYGPNQLWRNRGDGTFEDVTAQSGTGDPLWGTSATFFDYDNDNDADLYVANYVVFDVDENPRCFAASSRRDYCGPDAFRAQPDRLFRNRGDGSFEEVTARVLIGYEPGPGLGVTAADLNGDDRVDLYVANDGRVNQLWINQGDGTFVDEALFSGTALNRQGKPEASMGVDVADFDGDGDEDIFLTHLMGETNTLYVNDGTGLFEDRTVESGMAGLSLPYTSFGTAWIDFDNDGSLDLLAANGAVRILEEQAAAGDLYPLKQPNQLFRNVGGRFEDVSESAGDVFGLLEVSRGVSLGDLDNNGAVDIVVFNNNGPTRMLINQIGARAGWIGLGVRQSDAATWETGIRFVALDANNDSQWRRARADGSYCSANDPRVVLGLAEAKSVPRLRLHRSGDRLREYRKLPANRFVVFYESKGL